MTQREINSRKLITIFGGSGFVGRHTVRQLLSEGYNVRVACRRPELAGFLQPMGKVGQVQCVQANVRYPASVEAAVAGSDIVINMVGVLFERGRQRFDALQAEGAKIIAQSAKKQGVRTVIHLSAIGADTNSTSSYARSKAAGEQNVKTAFSKVIILRPSLIFGPEDEFFNTFAALAAFTPVLPLIGGGATRFQPVYVQDIARVISVVLNDAKSHEGKIYELGGADTLSFKELMGFILKTVGKKRLLLPVPFFVGKLIAIPMTLLPRPLITADQVELLKQDNIVSQQARKTGATLEGLGVPPTALRDILPTYLWRFRKHGQFAASDIAQQDL